MTEAPPSLQRRASALISERPFLVAVACAAMGAASSLTYAPFSLWFVAPLLCAVLLAIFGVSTPSLARRYGFWFGFGLFLSGTYWIYVSVHVFGRAPLLIALLLMLALVLIMALYLALTGWLVARLSGGIGWRLVIVGPAAWAFIEWLRGWFMSGFPWLSLGYAQIDGPLAAWAPVIGIYGMSYLLLVSAAGLVLLVFRPSLRIAGALLAVFPWLLAFGIGQVGWTEPDGEAATVTIVQGGVSQDEKWLPEQFRKTLDLYRNALLAAPGSDLVVWPEVAIPSIDVNVEPFLQTLQQDVKASGQTLLLGILEREPGGPGVHNSIFAYDGNRKQVYRKRHLVPFGEYFPVPAKVREWMRLMSLPNQDMLAGADEQPLLTSASGIQMAAAICYEDAYGAEQLYALPDAALLINISNDAWFGETIAPHQHLQVARMRALEAGRPVVRSTNNGISAFIDYRGRITETAPQFVYATLTADVVPRRGATPYSRVGNLPLILFLAFLVALAAALDRRGSAADR